MVGGEGQIPVAVANNVKHETCLERDDEGGKVYKP